MLKWTGIVVGALLGLFVVLMIGVALFVDPNDYKDDIAGLVEQRTGRQLTLTGDLELSVFPWLAIEMGPAELSDAPGFGDEPFLALQQARLGVRLWPLLRGSVQIGDITLDGVRVRLITNEQGRENWADLTESEPGEVAAPAEDDAVSLPTIASLKVQDAAVTLEDRRDASSIAITELNVETGRLESGEPFDLNGSFNLELSSGLNTRVQLATEVTPDLEANVHSLSGLDITLLLSGADLPADGVPVTARAAAATLNVAQERHSLRDLEVETTWQGQGMPQAGVPVLVAAASVDVDLANQTMTLAALAADVAGAKITGAVNGEEILDAPRLRGEIRMAEVSLRDWLPKLGVKVPETRDPKVLTRLTLEGELAATATSAEFSKMVLRLDDTTAEGSLGLADIESQAIRFDLDVDRIDVDRYLSPEKAAAAAESVAASSAPVEIPVDLLRELNIRGTLDVGEAVFAGLKLTKLRLGVVGRDGDLRLNPLEATAYGGQYRGNIGVNASGETARFSIDQQMTGVDFGPLFKDFFDTERVAGKGNFTTRFTAAGRDTRALVQTLDGALDFNVRDGAFVGTDLWYEIRRARALLRQQPIPQRTGPERTAFTAFEARGAFNDGVFTSEALQLAMQYLRIGGKGTVDLVKDEVDANLEATVLKIPAESEEGAQLQELVDARIPIRVSGTLTSPKALPDIEGYLKNRVRERVEEEKQKVEERVRETLQERLRRALGQ